MRVGVEVGGTFTDLVAVDRDEVRITKVPSVPARPDEGAFAALEAADVPLDRVEDLVHGSTVATNAVLERKGARLALVVTEGFRDILELQRHDRTRIYDLAYRKPVPVVRRRNTVEVAERILADGSVALPLDEAGAAKTLVPFLRSGRYEAVAVCLLNAYRNPVHEQAVAALIRRRFPDLPVTCSSELTREFREYERASTTTLAAYVRPVIEGYLGRFEARLKERGFRGRFSLMQSNGGWLPIEGMRRNAITSLFSGPAAGVMGALRQAGLAGHLDLITLDMGGTSADVCLVAGGRPSVAAETQVDGLPIRIPVLDIVTVGAGGGSIVWRDEGGMLRVGPESSAADPGPACYGRGGVAPTITDAHLIRGTIRPEAFLGGRMRVDTRAARAAFAGPAEAFGLQVEEMADNAVRVAEANLVRAIQLVSTERGRDPRDYVLVPFGGAGPLHAARVAEELSIRTILVPPHAGVISAYGLIASDSLHYDTTTRRVPLDEEAPAQVRVVFAELRERALTRFDELGLDGPTSFEFTLEMRFVGQAYEVSVPVDTDALDRLTVTDLKARFAEAHHRVYFHGVAADRNAEIVSFRLGVAAPLGEVPTLRQSGADRGDRSRCRIFDRGFSTAALLERAGLAPGEAFEGPALVEDATSTIYVPKGWRGEADESDNLILRAGP
ncbi:MAG: hydantoinase/oxoprolinase family protein [Alphaproteobacteria bacterium]